MAATAVKVSAGCVPRRSLCFDSFEEVLADIRSMQGRPHRQLGNWTLAQVCKHLADTFHGSMDGIRLGGHRLRRLLFGRRILAWTLKHGMPAGFTVDPRLNPPSGIQFDTAIAQLDAAISRYRTFSGWLHPHPIFGRLSRPDWDRLHLFHCAHHLSFIVPQISGTR